MTISTPTPEISTRVLERFGSAGPRYTSYPTADRFDDNFTARQYLEALTQRPRGVGASPLSVYVHIPFCESVCYYCACNKVVTRQHGQAEHYLQALETEARLHAQALGGRPAASQLHLGGGTPTFLSDAELERLVASLRAAFNVAPGAEASIEVDPRTVTAPRLHHLSALGFNRISFGVQDFDAAVQQAVHRVQPYEQVAALMAAAREAGFESINVDLIHGLPRQTAASFAQTLRQVLQLRPDRIALYGYAHLPERFKPQRRINAAELPPPSLKLAMLAQAIETFTQGGYDAVGMDHFALPTDELSAARRQGRLHRNFQGYSTRPECDSIGLGVSAIGRVGSVYSQNAKTLPEYYAALARGEFAVARGLAMDEDDLLRRAVIMAIMCQGEVSFDAFSLDHGVDFRRRFADELARARPLAEQGLIALDGEGLRVTPLGWHFVRAVAMVFDKYLHQSSHRAGGYSRIL